MPAGSEVEDSVTSNLVQLLKNAGITATFKKSYMTMGGRKEPDITIETPDGLFLLEAKMPPSGLPQAMTQIGEYKESIGSTEHLKGLFAAVYAAGIKKDFEIWFTSETGTFDSERFKKLDNLAEWVVKKIQEPPTPPATVSTQKVIDILNESVQLINQTMKNVSTADIEGIFGGRDFFSTVLDYDQESHISDDALKNAASYLLLNQILFYQILSSEISDYVKIDPKQIRVPADLHTNYFSRVLKDDYQPIFGFNVSAIIKGDEATSALKTVISAVQMLSPQIFTHDLLGKIFHNLIPLSLRKVVAAYYTNTEAAELLANIVVEKKNDKVIDPACGSGTLLVAAYNRKKSLYDKFGPDQHTRFLEDEIFGVDIMPFAAHLAAVNLALQAPLTFTNHVNVAIRDSSELAPGISISAAQEVIKASYRNHRLTEFSNGSQPQKRKITKGAVDLKGDEHNIQLPKFDVVIMNPPFTRFQRIPPHFKKKLQSRFSSPRYRDIVHGQLGLHGYFILLADKLLAPDGRLAAVLPLTTISLEGFYGIINLLLQHYQIEHVIVSTGRAAFSENTSLREILLVARKAIPVPEHRTKFTFIHASPEELTVERAREIAKKIRQFDGEEETNSDFYIRQINQYNLIENIRDLYHTVNLHSPQLVKLDEKIKRYFKPARKFTTIGAIEKEGCWQIRESTKGVERRGYYCLSILSSEKRAFKEHDVWVLEDETETLLKVKHRFNGAVFKIPKNCAVRQFRRFPGQTKIKLSAPYDYVVVRRFDDFDRFLSASGLADKNLISTIKSNIQNGEWERFVVKNASTIFGFYRGNITASGTSILCTRSIEPTFTGPGSSWSFHIPPDQGSLISLWLNSSFFVYHIIRDRNETEGGFITIDKYLLTQVPYPLIGLVNQQKLAELEREVGRLSFPSLLEQFQTGFEGRKKIDMFFLDYAGVGKEESEKFLKLLYDTMSKELLRLKGVMGG